MGRVDGKVVFITGVARGQGRAQAVRLAEEGAHIIGIDILEDIPSLEYPLATQADLDETASLIEKAGGRHVLRKADVRDAPAVREALAAGVAELGRLDGVVAQAGICPMGNKDPQSFFDAVDVDLAGVVNATSAAYPHLNDGASIVVTGSFAGLTSSLTGNNETGAGGLGYATAKRLISAHVHYMARALGPRRIRVNALHPTSVDTALMRQDPMYKIFRPDLPNPTLDDAMVTFPFLNLFEDPWISPEDVAATVLYLLSDDSRGMTGVQLRVDLGAYVKAHEYTM